MAPIWAEKMMDAGQLPNLDKLKYASRKKTAKAKS